MPVKWTMFEADDAGGYPLARPIPVIVTVPRTGEVIAVDERGRERHGQQFWCDHCVRMHLHGYGSGHRGTHCQDDETGPYRDGYFLIDCEDYPWLPKRVRGRVVAWSGMSNHDLAAIPRRRGYERYELPASGGVPVIVLGERGRLDGQLRLTHRTRVIIWDVQDIAGEATVEVEGFPFVAEWMHLRGRRGATRHPGVAGLGIPRGYGAFLSTLPAGA